MNVNGEAIYNTKPWHYQNDTVNGHFWYIVMIKKSLLIHHLNFSIILYLHRYTYRPDTSTVYGTQTQVYQSTVVIGAVKTNTNTKISLVGYDGDVTWKPSANNTIEISMPFLPVDTELRWAWVFKFENVAPTPKF